MVNRNNSKAGLVKATLDSTASKQEVSRQKNRLKDSSRYSNVFIENDVPAAQRAINANFRTLLNALGESNLQLKGSRTSVGQYGQEQYASHNRDESSYRQSGRDDYKYYRSHQRRDDFESDRRERSHGSYGNNRTINSRRDARYNYWYKCGFWNVRG